MLGTVYILTVKLTSGFGAGGEVCALHCDGEQSVRTRAMLVHLCSKCYPVSPCCCQNLQKQTVTKIIQKCVAYAFKIIE